MTDIPILVISLSDSEARFQRVAQELSRFGLTPIRIRALDGRRKASLLKAIFRRDFYCEKLKRPMTPGEIGCFASHVKALRYVARTGAPRAIILEDDAVFDDAFGAFYRSDLPRMLDAADVIKLEGTLYPHSSRDGLTVRRGANCRAIVPLRPSLCSAAYAVTAHGAASVAAVTLDYCEPFDFILNGYERYWAKYCEVRPFMVNQSGASSIIADHGRNSVGPMTRQHQPLRSTVAYGRKVIRRVASAGRTWVTANFVTAQ